MQKEISQSECNERVKGQLVKMNMAQEDFCEIQTKGRFRYQSVHFLVNTYGVQDGQFYSKTYALDRNYYFSLLRNSFVEEGLFVKDCQIQVTSSRTFTVCLSFLKSYAYQKSRLK